MVQLFKNKKKFNFFRGISLPGHNTRKCAEYFWVNLLIFAQISRNIHKSCFLRKCPGIVTQKSIDFQVTIHGNQLISGYCYSEVNLFPGSNTRKSIDFRVSCPGNHSEKNLISWISPPKRKYFQKYFSMWIQGPGTIDSLKKPEVKNLMLQSL